jgi:hypothetical protein
MKELIRVGMEGKDLLFSLGAQVNFSLRFLAHGRKKTFSLT